MKHPGVSSEGTGVAVFPDGKHLIVTTWGGPDSVTFKKVSVETGETLVPEFPLAL